MASSTLKFQNLILGSGQGGTALAQAFARAGQTTALVDRAHIGGCCVNEGCTPTKTLVASGRVAYLARRAGDYGVHTPKGSGGVSVDMEKVRQRKRDIVTSFRSGGERRCEAAGVKVLMGEAAFVGERKVKVEYGSGKEKDVVEAERVFISTGERPAKFEMEGSELVDKERILDSTSIQELGVVPKHLIVLGGGYIGLEFGQLFRRLGAAVTIVQRARQILPREDPEFAEALHKILTEDGIDVRVNTNAVRLQKSSFTESPVELVVKSKDGGDETTVRGDYLLAAIGRTPNTDMLDLAASGIKASSRGHVTVNDHFETSAPGVWALGDVTGPPAFTHIAYNHFRMLKNNLLDKPSDSKDEVKLQSKSDQIVPYVCYTDPQMGHVGLHESEARAQFPNKKIQTAKMPMAYVARALETDETRGLMKAVVDGESGQILGFSCLGIEGGEIMTVVQMAMMGGVTWMGLRDATFAHPALAESLNNLWGFLE